MPMQMKLRSMGTLAVLTAALALPLSGAVAPASANWLTKLAREAGEAGGTVGRVALGALENAAAHIKTLPTTGKGVALAAEAAPAGHWRFANRNGEVFTAGSPEEMGRVLRVLAPEAAGDSKLALYLAEDAVFKRPAQLESLPSKAELHVVIDKQAFSLRRGKDQNRLFAEVRPNLAVEIGEKAAFDEALWQLSRPVNKANIRVVSLEPGGPETLAGVPRRDPATGQATVDALDPYKLTKALGAIKGQTVLVTGRIDGRFLHFQPQSGPERTLVVGDLTAAAEAADVNLVILQSASPRQPGGRNWLWQRIEVEGLDEALKRASFADFLNALGATRGQLAVTARADGPHRVVVRAEPTGPPAEPVTGKVGEWAAEIVSQVTGNVVTNGIEAHARSKERQKELDSRIIPGVPSDVQVGYIVVLVLGLMGLPLARAWWARLWPPERREEYAGPIGYYAARWVKGALFVLLFLPVAGIPAFFGSLLMQAWGIVTLPFRFFGRLVSRAKGGSRAA